ncbi:MAG: DUF4276 family protein [Candidatus Brocadiae bacterium]|nr:DUF4276 family protein [Candidatus Brocadiia bacterium]
MAAIYINLAVEDALSEAVLRKILKSSGKEYAVGKCFGKEGFGYLKRQIAAFNHAAKITPFLVLTDLDRTECPPLLRRDWLSFPKHPNLIFRIAVREVEAWLLAHRKGFSKFAGISTDIIPQKIESMENPKKILVSLVEKSPKRDLREDIVPKPKSTATQGRNYNDRLILFVEKFWEPLLAMENSPSLKRALEAVSQFEPIL